MKRTLLSLLLPLLCMAAMQAQDLITLRDGTDIEAKVLQVSPDEIKYKQPRWAGLHPAHRQRAAHPLCQRGEPSV